MRAITTAGTEHSGACLNTRPNWQISVSEIALIWLRTALARPKSLATCWSLVRPSQSVVCEKNAFKKIGSATNESNRMISDVATGHAQKIAIWNLHTTATRERRSSRISIRAASKLFSLRFQITHANTDFFLRPRPRPHEFRRVFVFDLKRGSLDESRVSNSKLNSKNAAEIRFSVLPPKCRASATDPGSTESSGSTLCKFRLVFSQI